MLDSVSLDRSTNLDNFFRFAFSSIYFEFMRIFFLRVSTYEFKVLVFVDVLVAKNCRRIDRKISIESHDISISFLFYLVALSFNF